MSVSYLLYGILITVTSLAFAGACGVIAARLLKKFAPRSSEDQLPAGATGILVSWGVLFVIFYIYIVVSMRSFE